MKKFILLLTIGWCICSVQAQDSKYPFQNPSLPVEERVEDLISRLTLSEKDETSVSGY